MADSLGELLQAVDKYMAQNAKVKTDGPYMATKFAAMFDDPKSIFNPNGILKDVAEKIESHFEDLSTEISILGKIMEVVNDNAVEMGKMFKKSHDSLSSFNEHLNSFKANLAASKAFIPKKQESEKIQPPKAPYDFARENVLRKTEVMEVKLVGMGDSIIEKFNHWFESVKANSPTVVNNLPTPTDQNKEGKGLLSTVFGWIKSALKYTLLFAGGLFLAGKIKQFLDETDLGQRFKKTALSIFEGVSNFLTNFFNSGTLGRGMVDGVKFVSEVISSIWNGISTFWDKNKEAIGKAFSDTGDALNNYIVQPFLNSVIYPLWNKIKEKVGEIDWSETMGKMKDWFWNNVLAPIGKNISKDFEGGDFSEGFAKILGIGALGAVVLGLTGTLGAVTTGLASVVGILGVGASVGLIASLGVFLKLLTDGIKNQNNLKQQQPHLEKQANSLYNSVYEKAKNLKSLSDEIKTTNSLPDSTEKVLKLQMLETQKKIATLEKQRDEAVANAKASGNIHRENLSNAPWYMGIVAPNNLMWNKYHVNEFAKQEANAQQMFDKELLKLTKVQSEIFNDLESVKTQKDNPYVFPKQFTPLTSDKSKYPDVLPKENPKYLEHLVPKKNMLPKIEVKQTESTQKNHKDEIATKLANEKIDTIINVLLEGFGTLVNSTMQSGGQVANAVLASAGGSGQSSTPPSTMGGSDPVNAFRVRLERIIGYS